MTDCLDCGLGECGTCLRDNDTGACCCGRVTDPSVAGWDDGWDDGEDPWT